MYSDTDVISHYGTKRHSGRYEWGSGEDPYQHEPWNINDPQSFMSVVQEGRKRGRSDVEIARDMGISSGVFRAKISIAKNYQMKEDISRVAKLKAKGYSNVKIAEMMGITEGTVRNYIKKNEQLKNDLTEKATNALKDFVDKNKFVDVGPGTELNLGISDTRLTTALEQLKTEGYSVHKIYVDQMGTNHKTTMSVLVPPGVSYSDLLENKYNVHAINEKVVDTDGNIVSFKSEPPTSVSSKRIMVNYAEDGGVDRDGLIELRRGVDDISLGNARYAQVRIAVDGTHYLKGMAMYADDLPKGIDIRFNTNKHVGTPLKSDDPDGKQVLKSLKNDPNNPFGASIKGEETLKLVQKYYKDKDGNKKLSAINVVNEEGDWNTWSKNLASQFLSKQNWKLAKRQLDLSVADSKREFEEICKLTNPTIKKKLLEQFANKCDAAAEDLKAAPFPKQASKVIIPFTDLKDNEIYAPHLKEGTQVCLVRFPHGGTFEIPTLTVRNRGTEASTKIRNAVDAVGINSKVAERLSGADFDGDTALVIPLSNKVKIKTTEPMKGLKNFDPKESYPAYEGMPKMKPKTKQTEMGKITNLITDMTIEGATPEELERAVKHSMVVIDAEKHHLDYKRSERENGIAELKAKYQKKANGRPGGSNTLISRASSEVNTPETYAINGISTRNTDPDTGKRIIVETGRTFTRKGSDKVELATQKATRMSLTDDAYTLTSGGSKKNPGTQIEAVYAEFANQQKALANEARKEYLKTPNLKYDPEAKAKYSDAVSTLNHKLNTALKNAPRERQAQRVANALYEERLKEDPGMDNDHKKKARGQCLTIARKRTGAKKESVNITDYEWEAIQAGAISDSKLRQILDNTDADALKQRATPRTTAQVTSSMIALANSMAASGYTQADIAERLGVSTSTVSTIVSPSNKN